MDWTDAARRSAGLALAGPAAAAAGRADRRRVLLGAGARTPGTCGRGARRRRRCRPAAGRSPSTSPSPSPSRRRSPRSPGGSAHLIVGVFGARVAAHFGGPPTDYQSFDYAGTADERAAPARRGLRRLDRRRARARRRRAGPAGRPGRGPVGRALRWPSWCCTSTARRSTTAPRSPCCATCTRPPVGGPCGPRSDEAVLAGTAPLTSRRAPPAAPTGRRTAPHVPARRRRTSPGPRTAARSAHQPPACTLGADRPRSSATRSRPRRLPTCSDLRRTTTGAAATMPPATPASEPGQRRSGPSPRAAGVGTAVDQHLRVAGRDRADHRPALGQRGVGREGRGQRVVLAAGEQPVQRVDAQRRARRRPAAAGTASAVGAHVDAAPRTPRRRARGRPAARPRRRSSRWPRPAAACGPAAYGGSGTRWAPDHRHRRAEARGPARPARPPPSRPGRTAPPRRPAGRRPGSPAPGPPASPAR